MSIDLKIEQSFLTKFYENKSWPDLFGDVTVIMHGKSASGKSMMITQMMATYAARALDLDYFVMPYVYKYGNESVKGDLVKMMYTDVLHHCESAVYDIIETGTDFPDFVLPELFTNVRENNRTPILVYIKTSLSIAQIRNGKRIRPVPIELIHNQDAQEQNGLFRDICDSYKVPVVEITNEEDIKSMIDNAVDAVDEMIKNKIVHPKI